MRRKSFFPACLFLAVIFLGCASSVAVEDQDLSPAEYFQKAYEAADNKNYKLALKYYEVFQEKYPEELERNVWAEYEIALVYYKMGDMETAGELFTALIAKYNEAGSEAYPPGPKALAEEVLEKINS